MGAERLVAVAIKRDGEIHGANAGFKSHWQLRAAINPDGDHTQKQPGDIEGFVTSTGRFVDRSEGCDVAIACGQLSERWKTVQRDMLSSDLNW